MFQQSIMYSDRRDISKAMNHSLFLSWMCPIVDFFHDVPCDSEVADDSESIRESVESDNLSSL